MICDMKAVLSKLLVLCLGGLLVMMAVAPAGAVQLKKRHQHPAVKFEKKHQKIFPADDASRRALIPFMRHDRARRAVKQGQIQPLSEIRRHVQRQFQGRIVGVNLKEGRGAATPWIYDLRVLTPEGRVLSVQMDARNGRVIQVRGQK